MKTNKITIEERLEKLKSLYLSLDKIINDIPEVIPENIKEHIKKSILGDQELRELVKGIDNHRPPRLLLIGRTGVGKSSLVNALCDAYLAPISNVESCTMETTSYQCKDDDGRVLMEIMDSRGIAESLLEEDTLSAEDKLLQEINEFSPDTVIFMLSANSRDNVDKDVDFIKKIKQAYYQENLIELPVVVVVNKVDEISPSRIKDPEKYPENKKTIIEKKEEYYKKIIKERGLHIDSIISVSSCIDWTLEDKDVVAEEIRNLTTEEIRNLQIGFDGRYQIEKLKEKLESAINDVEAKNGLKMAVKLDQLVRKMANKITNIFASISGAVALSPLPFSDLYLLLIIQATLTTMISALSGREITLKAAKEFIYSLVGIGGAGLGFRLLAQQGSKLLNVLLPGSGSGISSVIAMTGTKMIGKAAIRYYIDEEDIEEVKKKFNAEKKTK